MYIHQVCFLFTDAQHDHRPSLVEVVEEPHEKVNPVRVAADNQVAGGDPMCVLTKFHSLPPWHPMEERGEGEKDNDSDGFLI